jgi:hypothetical protein
MVSYKPKGNPLYQTALNRIFERIAPFLAFIFLPIASVVNLILHIFNKNRKLAFNPAGIVNFYCFNCPLSIERMLIDSIGKVILITGASSGIGLSLSELYASQNAHLILCARSKVPLEGS